MDACCEEKSVEVEKLRADHRRILIAVLAINLSLFFVEGVAGLLARSTALLADSLDMLGDSLVYAFSLYVLWKSAEWKAIASMVKGGVMLLFGLGVLTEATYKMVFGHVPDAGTMGIIGVLVLVGNGICFGLLYRCRSDDLNMRSTWLCSRNDIIANLSVLIAAGGVAFFHSRWPDVLIGGAIASLFLGTAWTVMRESIVEFRQVRAVATAVSNTSEKLE